MNSIRLTNIKNNINPLNRGKYSAKNIFNTYISVDELKRHPEIYPSLKRDKKLRLDILTQKKPKIINIHELHNENKSKFATKLNSFYKVFFNNYKKQKNTSEDTNILKKENKYFLNKYKKATRSNEINQNRNKFNELKEEYEKRDYHLPSLDENKNLFNGNILLSNNKELKDYILYDLGTPKSNDKSMSFLYKINKKLGDKSNDKSLEEIYKRLDMDNYNKDKIEKESNKNLINIKNDINNLQQTINSIDDIDHFFKLGNKNYLATLNIEENNNKNSDKSSTRYNSATIQTENEKNQNNINANNKKNKKRKESKNVSIKNKKKLKIASNGIDNEMKKHKEKEFKTIGNNNISSDLSLINLYDKMSSKEDLLIYQPEIKDYLENKKYDVSVKLNPNIICNNFEKTREKICDSEFLKNNIQIRKQIGNIESKVEEINNNDIKAINKMNNIEDKIIKLFCDINNPRPKE